MGDNTLAADNTSVDRHWQWTLHNFSQSTDSVPFFKVNGDAEGLVEETYDFDLVASVDDGAKTEVYSFSLIIEYDTIDNSTS